MSIVLARDTSQLSPGINIGLIRLLPFGSIDAADAQSNLLCWYEGPGGGSLEYETNLFFLMDSR